MSSQSSDAAEVAWQNLLRDASRAPDGEPTRPAEFVQRAESLSDDCGPVFDLGLWAWNAGRHSLAEHCFLRIVGRARGADPAMRAAAWSNLATLARSRGHAARAFTCQQVALKQIDPCEARDHDADLINRANDALLAGDWNLAEQLLKAALVWARTADRNGESGDAWGGLAVAALQRGRWSLAKRRLRRAWRRHRQAADTLGMALDAWHLAQAHQGLREIDAARRAARIAIHRMRGCHRHDLADEIAHWMRDELAPTRPWDRATWN